MVNNVKIQRSSKKEKSTEHKMRQRILILRKACTIYQHSDINTLSPKQKSILQLWEHIQDCRDKDCKRKYCKSSCLILEHYNRCKRLNKSSKCEICTPVESRIERYSRMNQLTNNQKCATRKRKYTNTFSTNDQGNNTSPIRYKEEKISEEGQMSQIAGKRLKSNTLPNEHQRKEIRWHKSVKGGIEKYPVVPVPCCQVQHRNKQISKREKAYKTRNSNDMIISEKNNLKPSFQDSKEVSVRSFILQEDRKKIIDVAITLMSLKKSDIC